MRWLGGDLNEGLVRPASIAVEETRDQTEPGSQPDHDPGVHTDSQSPQCSPDTSWKATA